MRQRTEDETLIRRYLLGDAHDQEQEQTEQRLMTDRRYFEDYLRLEECLIDEYVGGRLNARDRERFEAHFLKAPERRESLYFAKAFRRNLHSVGTADQAHKRARQPIHGFWQSRTTAVMATLACAVALLGASTAWLVYERTGLKRQIAQLRSEQSKPTVLEEQLREQLEQTQAKLNEKDEEIASLQQATGSKPSAVNSGVATVVLVPGLGRGEDQSNRVYIANGVERLRLKLEASGEGYKNYRAEIRTAEGEAIFTSDKLKASRGEKIVEVYLAAKRFVKGDYILVLSGATGSGDYEKISTYIFRVLRR